MFDIKYGMEGVRGRGRVIKYYRKVLYALVTPLSMSNEYSNYSIRRTSLMVKFCHFGM